MPARSAPARRTVQRGEGSHTVVKGTGVDRKSSFSELFDYVRVVQAVAQIPVHGERDDVVGNAVAPERRTRSDGHTVVTAAPAMDLAPPPILSRLGTLRAATSTACISVPFH